MDAGSSYNMTQLNNQRLPLGVPQAGFASRGKGTGLKRLSLASAPKVGSISENPQDQLPAPQSNGPRTSRSHLLAGLRTAPRTPSNVPSSAPYNNTSYNLNTPKAHPSSAAVSNFPVHQYYNLPDQQVLAPPSLDIDETNEQMDQETIARIYATEMYLNQRSAQLQQLINLQQAQQQFAAMNLNSASLNRSFPMTPITPQVGMCQQPIVTQEIPGRPGYYIVYNALTGQSNITFDPNVVTAHVAPQAVPDLTHSPSNSVDTSAYVRSTQSPVYTSSRSVSPPKKSQSRSPPLNDQHGQAPYRRSVVNGLGHTRNRSSLVINGHKRSDSNIESAPKSAFIRPVGMPATPMTGSFAPGSARAGEHPTRQPLGPPPLEELQARPISTIEGSLNFASLARRSALTKLVKAGARRGKGSEKGSQTGVSSDEAESVVSEDGASDVSTLSVKDVSKIDIIATAAVMV